MKWYNHRAQKQHSYELKVQRDTHLGSIMPHVIQIANTFSRDAVAIGVLNYQDLIQAGYLGLLEAWELIDWDKINASPNPDGQLWSFLKKRIKWSIRRDIDKFGSHISIPINKLEEARNKMDFKGIDKVLVNIFPKFFDEELPVWDDQSSWASVQLEEIIEDELAKHVPSVDHRDILLYFYGIGRERLSTKQLADRYKKSTNYISLVINRTREKLKTEEFKIMIENFYNS